MKLQIPLVPLLAVLNLASGPASASCGSNNPPEEALEAARSLDIDRQSTGMQVRSALHNSPREGFVIPTYLHVVESKEKAGLVTDKMLHDQVWYFLICRLHPRQQANIGIDGCS